MEERIIVVKEITTKQTAKGNDYLSVKGTDGKFYNQFDQITFPLFEAGKAVKLLGETSGKYFNTQSVEKIKDVFQQKAAQEVANKIPDNPQEVGMWWKELGECLRSGYVEEKAMEIAYKAQMLSVLDIKVEKKKAE